jgi:hypothetical protein
VRLKRIRNERGKHEAGKDAREHYRSTTPVISNWSDVERERETKRE